MARASKYEDAKAGILDAIAAASHGKAPTVRDLAHGQGVSVSTMHSYLKQLRDEGWVEWRNGKHRSLRLTPMASQARTLPGR